jgi:hypothetical protein
MRVGAGSIDHSETFDEFLATQGLLAETEEAALKQIFADQARAAIASAASADRHGPTRKATREHG